MEEFKGKEKDPPPGVSRCKLMEVPVPDKLLKKIRGHQIETAMHKVKCNAKREMLQEELCPLRDLLPEELWLYVADIGALTRLDVLNLSRTNSQLHAILSPSACFLFPEVLPFLVKYLTRKSDLLKCRSVCKGWLKDVDNFLSRNHPCRRPFSDDQSQMDLISMKRNSSDTSLHRFGLEYIQFTPASQRKFNSIPRTNSTLTKVIFPQAVSFNVNCKWDELSIQTFFTSAKKFLIMHGHLVTHFKFVQYNFNLTTEVFYQMLLECACLMPNLRSFHVTCFLNKYYGRWDHTINIRPMTVTYPFPRLRYLQNLHLEGLQIQLRDYFIAHFEPSVTKLTLDYDAELLRIPESVQELHFGRFTCVSNPTHGLILLNCTKLTLDLSLDSNIDRSNILEMLDQFPNLVWLRIVLCERNKFAPFRRGEVKAIVYFEIDGDRRDMFEITPILRFFPALKYFHWKDTSNLDGDPFYNDRYADVQQTDRRNFDVASFLDRGDMYNSPIWDNLGQLKIFTYESSNGSKRSFWNREHAIWMRKQMQETSLGGIDREGVLLV